MDPQTIAIAVLLPPAIYGTASAVEQALERRRWRLELRALERIRAQRAQAARAAHPTSRIAHLPTPRRPQ